MFILNKEKSKTIDNTKLTNQESVKTLGEKNNNKYLGLLEADISKKAEK